MINNIIITEFKRLIAYLKEESDNFKKLGDKKKLNQNQFRVRQLSRVLSILKNYPDKITNTNYKELIDIPGIGKGSIERIGEILKDGKLSELGNFVDEKQEKNKILSELEEVVGIGHSNALELYDQGIKSVKMLKQKIKSNEIEVNNKIKLGLKYYNVYKKNIPRSEITKIYKLMEKIIKKLNKKYELPKNKEYIFEICGSYRRKKDFSNDIDLLISKKGTKTENKSGTHLNRIITKLKSNLTENDKKPLLVDDMTDGELTTKYMGFSKYKDNHVRRIDIRFVTNDSFPSALLYFTGSGEFNVKMRNIAKEKGYKLSEYGLFDKDENKVKLKSEEAIFKFLGM